jgi:type I restriction enzyme M protein
MVNERKTEQLVRSMLKDKGYLNDSNIVIEEQASDNPRINKLLKNASKAGKGQGYPEFIIQFKNNSDHIILVECKAKVSKHESVDRKNYKDFAVDGVLLYASYLKDDFNVTAIAVSGENEREKKISSFLWLKGNYTYKNIQDKTLLTPDEVSSILTEQSKPISESELISKAIEYNSFLHTYSIPEVERCTLISAILIALQDRPFLSSYKIYDSNKDLINNLLSACERVLKANQLDERKTTIIIGEYSKFKNNVSFNSKTHYNKKSRKEEVNTILKDFIISINENILPYINNSRFDVLGKFYTQFIRYAGGDKKTGLVLTPSHITDFFCEIADLSANDIVFDECCGTAGFLVSAMNYMLKKAGNDSSKKKHIKSAQLLGIEKRPDMFSHACSNMMMRGDGKSNILFDSCFDEKNKAIIKKQKPNVAFLNPPYQDGNADEQLEFIENALDCIIKGGTCVAICQMSTVVSEDKNVLAIRERLLNEHTLEAVFTMPTDLFYPIGVNTCILVFTAHNAHPNNKKTFFGYFKDDGFEITKNHGRTDKYNKWETIKSKWLSAFVNRESIIGLSVMKEVTFADEWCAEAYMETDYPSIKKENFIETIHSLSTFLFSVSALKVATAEPCHNKAVNLQDREWKPFDLVTYFQMYAGKYYSKESFRSGLTPLVSSSDNNNGIKDFTDLDPKFENCITIGKVGMYSFYQPLGFIASSDVTVLSPLFEMNAYMALFIVSVLSMDKYKWSYGRQIRLNDSQKLRIKLPAKADGLPDWQFMEYYIKSLPYSSNFKDLAKPSKGLSDLELAVKYEKDEEFDLEKPLKKMLKPPKK